MEEFFFEQDAHQAEKEIWVEPEVIAASVVTILLCAGASVLVIFYLLIETFSALYRWLRPMINAPPEGDR